MEERSSEDDDTSTSFDDVTQRIVLHVYDDESREFTSLTTYHGMNGLMLLLYRSHPTFTKTTDRLFTSELFPAVTICRVGGAEQWKLYQEIWSRPDIRSSFDLMILGAPMDAKDELNLRLIDAILLNTTKSDFILKKFLQHSRVPCEELVQSVHIGSRQVKNHCKDTRWSLTDIGYCTTFSQWSISSPVHTIRIDVVSRSDERIVFRMHSEDSVASMRTDGLFVRRGKTARLSVEARKKLFLRSDEWGNCNEGSPTAHNHTYSLRYSRTNCERNCIAEEFLRQCGCVPFYDDTHHARECSFEEHFRCGHSDGTGSDRSIPKCTCQVDCESMDFTRAKLSYLNNNQSKSERSTIAYRNRTTIEISMHSRRLQIDQQSRRIKAVDLLSYVAGSMGLFLGMSCVTLLEIFIYLFKTVWGVFNNQRHKSYYLENLLGDDSSESDSVSHEEIVITTKTKVDDNAFDGTLDDHLNETTDGCENSLRFKLSITRMKSADLHMHFNDRLGRWNFDFEMI
ncbi:unnamed protein product [Nippostrongylus brasiliensis]|uniref:Amiloride-sensitive sodium channel n=1 Tax=Nippostrongylus brasiliensis TaxID=27835 RepID=A0A0N4Y6G4_NIPBR|nr:unnamed protein product [Nippostrongylus brasiliensis]